MKDGFNRQVAALAKMPRIADGVATLSQTVSRWPRHSLRQLAANKARCDKVDGALKQMRLIALGGMRGRFRTWAGPTGAPVDNKSAAVLEGANRL
jgi:hypothetical protein